MSFSTGLRCPQHDGGECGCRTVHVRCSVPTAAEWGLAERLRQTLTREKARRPDAAGYTPLHLAAQQGHREAVDVLLAFGADVNAADCGCTPLHRAAFAGHLGVVERLLQAGANPATPDRARHAAGDLPVHKAARQGHQRVLEALQTHAPELGARRNAEGRTPRELLEEALAAAREVPPLSDTPPPSGAAPAPVAAPAPTAASRAPVPVAFGMACPGCDRLARAMKRLPCCGALVCASCFRARPLGVCSCAPLGACEARPRERSAKGLA